MVKTWSEYFKESMDSVKMPVPVNLYTGAAVALANISSILNALKQVSDKDALTVAALISQARRMGLLTAIRAGTLSELSTMCGGVLASGYIGALLGAAIYATEKTYLNWSDKIIDWATASEEFAVLERVGAKQRVIPTHKTRCMKVANANGITMLASTTTGLSVHPGTRRAR